MPHNGCVTVPDSLLEAAVKAMNTADSYHFIEERTFDEIIQFPITKMGYYQAPDRLHANTT